MKLKSILIKNYRNIDKLEIAFNPDINYIIGENNLGKSNFLALLTTMFNGKSFEEEDFYDQEKSIEIELSISINKHEQGFFGDSFSPKDSTMLNIRITQSINETYPTIMCIDSNEIINFRQIKKINFFKYETTVTPSKELRFDTKKGFGLLISTMVERFSKDVNFSFLNNEQIEQVMRFVNDSLKKINSFRDYSLKATFSSNPTELLTKLLFLSDGERKINDTGSGIQYMAMASIYILCQIMELFKNKSIPFENHLYTNEEGKRILPIIFSIDEPEIHLHPFLQRSLIGYYKKVLKNKDPEFVELLSKCFDIDGIDGQLIIVTHSTDTLVGDYKNLIRFYKKNDKTTAISGYLLSPKSDETNDKKIKKENEKHLIMRFKEIKEAFYSKCAILIEGETEYGCINDFATKMKINLDDYGICVINACGERSIKPIRELLKFFAIPSVAIYDGDVKSEKNMDDNAFYTTELCFEIEIVKKLFFLNKKSLIKQIVVNLDEHAEENVLDSDFVKKPFNKMHIDTRGYKPKKLSDVNENDESDFCQMYSAWFMASKGVLLGRIIGELVQEEDIPECYVSAIKKAVEIAKSV